MSDPRQGLPPAPDLPAGAPGRNGFTWRRAFGVIILCADEAEQRRLYERLNGEGLRCRPVAT